MRTRGRFWKQVLREGVPWSHSLVVQALNLIAALTLLGLASANVVSGAWYAVAAFFALVFLAGLAEGAYRTWERTEAARGIGEIEDFLARQPALVAA